MNKAQVLTFVSAQLADMHNSDDSINGCYWTRAKAATEINEMIVWSKCPPYGSFSAFIKEEFTTHSMASVNTWIAHYRRMRKVGYSLNELKAIAKKVSYTKTVEFSMYGGMKRRLTVASFIKRATAYKLIQYNTKTHNENNVMVHLNLHYRNELDRVLAPFGYAPGPNGRREGISKAFCRLLDTL